MLGEYVRNEGESWHDCAIRLFMYADELERSRKG
jgi:hypothetical protein